MWNRTPHLAYVFQGSDPFSPKSRSSLHKRILEALEEPYRTIVLVDAVTGMRASELFALRWSDVDFERRMLFIWRTYYRGEFGLLT
jgi:integrase